MVQWLKNHRESKFHRRYVEVFLVFMLLHPVMDALTSLGVRYLSVDLSLGMVLRSLFLGMSTFYVLYEASFRGQRKKIFVYAGVLALYTVVFFLGVFVKDLSLGQNLKEMIKILYFPVVSIAFYMVYEKDSTHGALYLLPMVYTLYTGMIFIAFITDTGFATYGYLNIGQLGWFYAGNEVSGILAFLMPLSLVRYIEILAQKEPWLKKLYATLGLFLLVFTTIQVGTKALVASSVVFMLIYLLMEAAKALLRRDTKAVISVILLMLLLGTTLYTLRYSPFQSSMNEITENIGEIVDREDESEPEVVYDEETGEIIKEEGGHKPGDFMSSKPYQLINLLLSNRLYMTRELQNTYLYGDAYTKLMGVAYHREGTGLYKMLEMDYLSLLYRQGLLGFILILLPHTVILIMALRKLAKHRRGLSMETVALLFTAMAILGYAFITGHVFVAPSVSFFAALLLVLFHKNLSEGKEKYLWKN